MGYLIELLIGVGGSLLAAEAFAHADPVSRWLVNRAAARLSDEGERERRREEWLADLNDMPGAMRKLLWCMGCHWAAIVANRQASRGQLLTANAPQPKPIGAESERPRRVGYAPWVPLWLRILIAGAMGLVLPLVLTWFIADKVRRAVRFLRS
jgi:hypothetical protein